MRKALILLFSIIITCMCGCGGKKYYRKFEDASTRYAYTLKSSFPRSEKDDTLASCFSNGVVICINGNELHFVGNDSEIDSTRFPVDKYGTVVALGTVDDEVRILSSLVKGDDREYYVCKYDQNNKRVTLIQGEKNVENVGEYFKTGDDAVIDDNFAYIISKDGSMQPAFDWNTVGIISSDIVLFSKYDEDAFWIVTESDTNVNIGLIESTEEEGVNGKTELVLSGVNISPTIREYVNEVNSSGAEYRVTIRDYACFEDPYTALNLDYLSGDDTDILMLSEINSSVLIRNGMLLNLEDRIDEEEYIEPYLNAIKKENGIYGVAPLFCVYTLLGKEGLLGNSVNWTFEDMLEVCKKNPQLEPVYGATYGNILDMFCFHRIDDFCDFEKGEVHFDTEEFTEMLEYMMKFVDGKVLSGNFFDGLHGGRTLMADVCLSSLDDFQIYRSVVGDEIVLKGYPDDDGDGCYMSLLGEMGISSRTENIEYAWDFINKVQMYLASETEGFPTRRDDFEKFFSKKGITNNEGHSLIVNGTEISVESLNEEDVNILKSYINLCDSIIPYNEELQVIIIEEIGYLINGENSVEECVSKIQNRASVWVKE